MIRKGLVLSAFGAAMVIGTAPAQASVDLGAVSGLINQLQTNSSFNSSNMSFTICQNGVCQTLFTGLAGLHNYTDLSAFNSWAGTSNSSSGGYFDNYKPTFSGVTSYFGNQSPPEQSRSYPTETPVPEPATWAMLILGFAFVGAAMRRRRAAAVSFG